MKTYFSFCHDYFKLSGADFTTVRGANAAKQYQLGQTVQIIRTRETPSNGQGRLLFSARITGIETKPLCDIPLELLQFDAAFKGYNPRTHADFMGLVNSLRGKWGKMKSTTETVTIFRLKRV